MRHRRGVVVRREGGAHAPIPGRSQRPVSNESKIPNTEYAPDGSGSIENATGAPGWLATPWAGRYDEAVTTPTEESVRRALAIQLIINREWGLAMNENPLQGSYVIDQLTDLVEEAVLLEFDRISERGGVLGAMETGYQRGRIQDESMLYEHRKHDGSLPIVGVS